MRNNPSGGRCCGGGGGGGGYSPNMANGGKGGDGIVIIRCKRIPKGVVLIVL